jgi:hypothetical protein
MGQLDLAEVPGFEELLEQSRIMNSKRSTSTWSK